MNCQANVKNPKRNVFEIPEEEQYKFLNTIRFQITDRIFITSFSELKKPDKDVKKLINSFFTVTTVSIIKALLQKFK